MGDIVEVAGGLLPTIFIFAIVMKFGATEGQPLERVVKAGFITMVILLGLRMFGGGFNQRNFILTILHIPGVVICAAVAGYFLRRNQSKLNAERDIENTFD